MRRARHGPTLNVEEPDFLFPKRPKSIDFLPRTHRDREHLRPMSLDAM